MAYAGQFMEGIESLYLSMGIDLNTPVLYCDNRAACYLTQGTGEWRTKALINRILGLTRLAELRVLDIKYKPTTEMAADIMTKFMKRNVVQRCRQLVGCIALPALQGA